MLYVKYHFLKSYHGHFRIFSPYNLWYYLTSRISFFKAAIYLANFVPNINAFFSLRLMFRTRRMKLIKRNLTNISYKWHFAFAWLSYKFYFNYFNTWYQHYWATRRLLPVELKVVQEVIQRRNLKNNNIISLYFLLKLPQYWLNNVVYFKLRFLRLQSQWINFIGSAAILRYNNLFNNKYNVYNELLLLVIALHYRDLFLFNKCIQTIFVAILPKQQYLIIANLLSFLRLFLKKYAKYTQLKGLSIRFSGKIGRTGSVRKKRIYFNYGSYSVNSCTSYSKILHSQVMTITGVLGIKSILYYKVNC